MASGRVREIWRHRASGEVYLVEVEDERVLSSHGPVTEDEVSEESLEYKQVGHGRTPAFTAEAAEMDARQDEYDRTPLRAEKPVDDTAS